MSAYMQKKKPQIFFKSWVHFQDSKQQQSLNESDPRPKLR